MTAHICFTMDNLSDAADLGRGVISSPRPAGQRPALELGFPAMLDLFEPYGVKVTHFVEGWNGEAHPEILQELIGRGHTLGMHGWQHEKWCELDKEKTFSLAKKATDALEKAAGVRPHAFRAPGGKRGIHTAEILQQLDYRIDASLDNSGEDGGAVQKLGESLWTIPYLWDTVDATHWLWHKRSIEDVEDRWMKLLDETAENGKFLAFIWHPHVMGIDAERRALGDRILKYVSASRDFEIVTLSQLVSHYKEL